MDKKYTAICEFCGNVQQYDERTFSNICMKCDRDQFVYTENTPKPSTREISFFVVQYEDQRYNLSVAYHKQPKNGSDFDWSHIKNVPVRFINAIDDTCDKKVPTTPHFYAYNTDVIYHVSICSCDYPELVEKLNRHIDELEFYMKGLTE